MDKYGNEDGYGLCKGNCDETDAARASSEIHVEPCPLFCKADQKGWQAQADRYQARADQCRERRHGEEAEQWQTRANRCQLHADLLRLRPKGQQGGSRYDTILLFTSFIILRAAVLLMRAPGGIQCR